MITLQEIQNRFMGEIAYVDDLSPQKKEKKGTDLFYGRRAQ